MFEEVLSLIVAMEDHAPVGEIVDVMGKPYRLNREISREEYDRQLEMHAQKDADYGLPVSKRGIYHVVSKRYEPLQKPPASFRYCYEIEPATAADLAGTPEA